MRPKETAKSEKEPDDVLLNPMRFRIAGLVNPIERSASEVAEEMDIDLKLATYHIQKLARSGIVEGNYRERIVQNRPFLIKHYSLTAKGMAHLRRIKNKITV